MTDQQAELHDVEPLEALAGAIERLPGHVAEQLAEAEAEFMPRLRRLRRAEDAAREAVRAAQAAVAEAEDDDERRAAERWLEEAEDAKRRLDAAIVEVHAALGRYKAEARELDNARRGIFPAAGRHLQTVIANARAYSAVSVPSGGGAAASGGGHASSAAAGGSDPDDPTGIPLPPGFAWIPVARIAPDQFVDFARDPPKGVSLETIEQGMRSFYATLLPLLRSTPGTTRDDLAAIDKARGTLHGAAGAVHPESLSNLGDIFLFGSDVMAAEMDAAGAYRLNSGRHRATMARDLGMSHVPARVPGRGGQ